MGMTDKAWDALTTIIKMNDKVISFAGVVKDQQLKIEKLAERIIRLETTIDLMMRVGEKRQLKGE